MPTTWIWRRSATVKPPMPSLEIITLGLISAVLSLGAGESQGTNRSCVSEFSRDILGSKMNGSERKMQMCLNWYCNGVDKLNKKASQHFSLPMRLVPAGWYFFGCPPPSCLPRQRGALLCSCGLPRFCLPPSNALPMSTYRAAILSIEEQKAMAVSVSFSLCLSLSSEHALEQLQGWESHIVPPEELRTWIGRWSAESKFRSKSFSRRIWDGTAYRTDPTLTDLETPFTHRVGEKYLYS